MSIKKILILGIILSLLTICAVSASTTKDTSADTPEIMVTLEKILANNGYNDKHEVDPACDYAYNYTNGSNYVMLNYEKNKNLSISTFDSSHFHEKTINNTKGIYGEKDGEYFFHYQRGKDVVYTITNNKSMIEKLALGN